MSHWFEKCLACKLYKDNTCVCLSLLQWYFTCRVHFSSESWLLRLSVRAFFRQLFIIVCFCFLDFFIFIESLVSSCLYCRDGWTATFFMFVQSSCWKKKDKSRERERTCTQNGEDRIVKVQELVYNKPNLISSHVQYIAIQLYYLFVEKFAFWLIIYIKHSIHLTIKHSIHLTIKQRLNETRSWKPLKYKDNT